MKEILLLLTSVYSCSVYICGNWELTPSTTIHGPSKELIVAVESMVSPLIYIGFGSMETLYSQTVTWKKAITSINAG